MDGKDERIDELQSENADLLRQVEENKAAYKLDELKASFRDESLQLKGEIRVLRLKNEKLEEMIEQQNGTIGELQPYPKKADPKRLTDDQQKEMEDKFNEMQE